MKELNIVSSLILVKELVKKQNGPLATEQRSFYSELNWILCLAGLRRNDSRSVRSFNLISKQDRFQLFYTK